MNNSSRKGAQSILKARLTSNLNQSQQTINELFGYCFLCVYGHIHFWKFDGYPPLDRLHKIQYTPATGKPDSPSPNISTIWLSVNFDFLIPHLQRNGSLYFQLVHRLGELTEEYKFSIKIFIKSSEFEPSIIVWRYGKNFLPWASKMAKSLSMPSFFENGKNSPCLYVA